jgi:hypothetical protein
MKSTREDREPEGEPRICGNEGCGRPAEKRLCDVCGLEWSLFHREERVAKARAEHRRR